MYGLVSILKKVECLEEGGGAWWIACGIFIEKGR